MNQQSQHPRDTDLRAELLSAAATGAAEWTEERSAGENPVVSAGDRSNEFERGPDGTCPLTEDRHPGATKPVLGDEPDAGDPTAIQLSDLWLRCRDLAQELAEESERAEVRARELARHRVSAARCRSCLEEMDDLLARIGQFGETNSAAPRNPPKLRGHGTKPSLRYRTRGATTDIVAVAYATPGIETEQLITTVYEKYKDQGTSRDTIHKMVNRLIREKYASKRRGQVYLEDVCKRAWEASPLFPAPAPAGTHDGDVM